MGYKLYPEVIPLLHAIRSPPQNWPYNSTTIGVITNSDPRVTSVLDSLTVEVRSCIPMIPDHYKDKALLDFVTLSYDVGCEKPDIGIFNAAKMVGHQRARGSGAGVWRYVHVGDDLVKDYQGAKSAGWKGILVDRITKKKLGESKVIIKGLDEIIEVLIDLEKDHCSV